MDQDMSLLPELEDIQGIIVRGYGRLKGAYFVLLRIHDAAAAKRWLGEVAVRNGAAHPSESETCVNIAFTYPGLDKLGLDREALEMFSGEFREGMAGTEHRRRILGDLDECAPELWEWGGPRTAEVDLLLMLYAAEDQIEALYQAHTERFPGAGLEVIKPLSTIYLPGRKEHFGFHDGIAQPRIEGYHEPDPPENTVAVGEFILGYPNAYGQYTQRPLLSSAQDRRGLLPEGPNGSGQRDFGRNGSYLVFRQLRQEVAAFWRTLDAKSRAPMAGRMLPRALPWPPRWSVAGRAAPRWSRRLTRTIQPWRTTTAFFTTARTRMASTAPSAATSGARTRAMRSIPIPDLRSRSKSANGIASSGAAAPMAHPWRRRWTRPTS
jgi:deferrochelatase/peroxidase EfeB